MLQPDLGATWLHIHLNYQSAIGCSWNSHPICTIVDVTSLTDKKVCRPPPLADQYIYIYKQLNNDEVWAQPSCSHLESTPRIAKWAIIAHIRTHPPVVGAPILLEEGCIGGLCLDDPEHFQVAKKHSRTRVVQESHQVMHGYAVLPTVGACQGQSRCKTTATIHLTVSMLPLHPGCIQK